MAEYRVTVQPSTQQHGEGFYLLAGRRDLIQQLIIRWQPPDKSLNMNKSVRQFLYRCTLIDMRRIEVTYYISLSLSLLKAPFTLSHLRIIWETIISSRYCDACPQGFSLMEAFQDLFLPKPPAGEGFTDNHSNLRWGSKLKIEEHYWMHFVLWPRVWANIFRCHKSKTSHYECNWASAPQILYCELLRTEPSWTLRVRR